MIQSVKPENSDRCLTGISSLNSALVISFNYFLSIALRDINAISNTLAVCALAKDIMNKIWL